MVVEDFYFTLRKFLNFILVTTNLHLVTLLIFSSSFFVLSECEVKNSIFYNSIQRWRPLWKYVLNKTVFMLIHWLKLKCTAVSRAKLRWKNKGLEGLGQLTLFSVKFSCTIPKFLKTFNFSRRVFQPLSPT